MVFASAKLKHAYSKHKEGPAASCLYLMALSRFLKNLKISSITHWLTGHIGRLAGRSLVPRQQFRLVHSSLRAPQQVCDLGVRVLKTVNWWSLMVCTSYHYLCFSVHCLWMTIETYTMTLYIELLIYKPRSLQKELPMQVLTHSCCLEF